MKERRRQPFALGRTYARGRRGKPARRAQAAAGQVKLDLFGQDESHAPEAYPWAGGLIFDYFAGGGGASTGLAQGLGRSPDFAINHNRKALAMHEANHPETEHLHEDVWTIDPRKVAAGRPVLLLWGSPDCRHFSIAKGGKPVKKQIRGLAWVLHRFAGKVLPAILMMENVPEFETWGPLIAARDGEWDPKHRRRVQNRKGEWVEVKGGWVKKVNGKLVEATGRVLKVDGTVAGPGERVPRDQQLQRPDPNRRGETFKAFVRGLERKGYVVEWRVLTACDYGAPTSRKRLFLVARRDGLPIVWPAPTHGDPASLAVRAGHLQPWRTAAECLDYDIPCPSIFERGRPLAEATCRRIARGVMRYVVDAGDDAFLVCLTHGANRGERALVVPSLMSIDHKSSSTANAAAADPLTTVTSKARHALIVPTLVQAGYGEREGQDPRVPGLEKPLGTIVAGGRKHAMVAAFLAKNFTGVVGSDCRKPLPTVTATDHHSFVAVHLQRDFGMSTGASARAPIASITAGANGHQALVASHLVRLKANGRQSQGLREPLGSIQAQGTHFAEVRSFLVKYFGTATDGQPTTEPFDTVTAKPRFALVTVGLRRLRRIVRNWRYRKPRVWVDPITEALTIRIRGRRYIIADIGFRMLEPGELFKGQGFPDDYEHEEVTIDGETISLTKTEQVAACGNSVPPQVVRALVEANVPRYAAERRVAA